MTLPAGSRLAPYEILDQVGAGGRGEVHRAEDPRLGREVAIKVLPASFSLDANRLRRRPMRIAWRLAVIIVAAFLSGSLSAQPSPGCDEGFVGSARADVKNRRPSEGAGCGFDPAELADPEGWSEAELEAGSDVITLPQTGMSAASFLSWYHTYASLNNDHTLVLVRSGNSQIKGQTYQRYEHRYKNLKVSGAQGLTLHLDAANEVVAAFGRASAFTASTIVKQSSTTIKSMCEAAVASALGARGAVTYDTARSNICTKQIEKVGSSWKLVHNCQMVAKSPVGEFRVFIDDPAKVTLRTISTIQRTWLPATAKGVAYYDGHVGPFAAEVSDQTGTHRLCAGTVVTKNAQHAAWSSTVPTSAVDFTEPDFDFDTPNVPSVMLSAGVSAHWGMQLAFDHFASRFGVNPLVTNAPVLIFVDVNENGGFYDNVMDLIVLGYLNQTYPVVGVASLGHELAHLYARRSGNFDYAGVGEYRAIHEAFADIMGELAENALPGGADWLNGGEYGFYIPIADPAGCLPPATFCPYPDVYLFPPWQPVTSVCDGSNDLCGAHKNSSIGAVWFHRLAFSGKGTNSQSVAYDVKGIGVDTAAKIFFGTIVEKIQPGDGYPNLAAGSEAVAKAMCGDFSQATLSTHNAWHSTGVFSSVAAAPYSNPADNATSVSVFSDLKWIRGAGEAAWEVQLSADPTFAPFATQTYATAITGTDGAYQVGVLLNPTLLPNTTYYWRVRPVSAEPLLNCWRPAKKLTTSNAAPVPISPKVVQGPQHPWLLPFTFTKIHGADEYQVQIAYAPALDQGGNPTQLVFQTLTFPAAELSGTADSLTTEITVPVQKDLYWRVRARKGSSATSWSAFEGFVTKLPKPVLVSPIGVNGLDPWPVGFEWQFMKGAEFTWWMVSAQGHHYSKDKLYEKTTYERNLPGTLYFENITWGVKALGPDWGWRYEPISNREWSADSTPATFTTDGTLTAIDPADPQFGPQWPACQDSATQYIQWVRPHPESARYKVEVYEAHCPDLPNPCTLSALRESELIEDSSTSNTQGMFLDLVPLSDNDNPGYFWYVRAYAQGEVGEEDVPGWYSVQGASYINPSAPQLVSPLTSTVKTGTGDIIFSWSSEHAHGGHFLLTVYIGSNCGSVDASLTVQGFSQGTTSALLHSPDWEPASLANSGPESQSWDVRPIAYSPCTGGYWSGCHNFTVEATQSSEPPPQPPPSTQPIDSPLAFELTEASNDDFDMIIFTPDNQAIHYYDSQYYVQDSTYQTGPDIAYWSNPVSGQYTIYVHVWAKYNPNQPSISLKALENGVVQQTLYQGAVQNAFTGQLYGPFYYTY